MGMIEAELDCPPGAAWLAASAAACRESEILFTRHLGPLNPVSAPLPRSRDDLWTEPEVGAAFDVVLLAGAGRSAVWLYWAEPRSRSARQPSRHHVYRSRVLIII